MRLFSAWHRNSVLVRVAQMVQNLPAMQETQVRFPGWEDVRWECSQHDIGNSVLVCVAQMVQNLPAMQETQVQFPGWEDPLEKGMATHSGVLAWRIPWTEEPGTVHGVAKGWTRLSHYHYYTIRQKQKMQHEIFCKCNGQSLACNPLWPLRESWVSGDKGSKFWEARNYLCQGTRGI